jgi:hypothetical protein
MNRRLFLLSGVGVASFLSLGALRALAGAQLDDALMSTTPMLTDNDEFPLSKGGRPDMKPKTGMIPTAYGLQLLPYETVITHLSPFLESAFDMFFLANSATESTPADFIPHQHMKVIRRVSPGPLFDRDANGIITGITNNAEIYLGFDKEELFKISSGAGGNHILTYSGIFRFNHAESKKRIGSNESFNAHMSYSMYVDVLYNTGVEARVAIHGTPARNYHLLGNSRASEGCLRVRPENAKQIRTLLLDQQMWSEDLPEFDRRAQLPSQELRDGKVKYRPGVKALLITFNGYKNPGKNI